MFEKVLIANRGEIAARIVRGCKKLGVKTVAVYSEADAGAPHTQLADEAVCIGPAHVTESYLRQDTILTVAAETGADALHPGYGLLSENAEFVRKVETAGLNFIGPSAEVMLLMGDKARARKFATDNGVPVVPGSSEPIPDEDAAVAFAESFGYPILVKAAAGGGGIGMKIATKEKKLRKAIAECQRRGESAFGDPTVYLERYVEQPRHIEIQVFGDNHGNAVHLFERECSVQRRHQKVIEEAPSMAMGKFPGLREKMTEAALKLVKASNYVNAGTVEFIVSPDGEFYFIEMNTRLQVEHPVTEAITGFDLVCWQLQVAAGEPLPVSQADISIHGHAIEARIYAEDPAKMFMPKPGRITTYVEPTGEGIRVDSGVVGEWDVTPYYDPMVAKVIAHAGDRATAISRLKAATAAFEIGGLTTNLSMHQTVLDHPDFIAATVHTSWLETIV